MASGKTRSNLKDMRSPAKRKVTRKTGQAVSTRAGRIDSERARMSGGKVKAASRTPGELSRSKATAKAAPARVRKASPKPAMPKPSASKKVPAPKLAASAPAVKPAAPKASTPRVVAPAPRVRRTSPPSSMVSSARVRHPLSGMPAAPTRGLIDLSGLGGALGGVLGGLSGALKGVTGSLGNTLGSTLQSVSGTLGALLEPLQQLKLAGEQGDSTAARQYGHAVDMLRTAADQGRDEASDVLAQLGEALGEDESKAA